MQSGGHRGERAYPRGKRTVPHSDLRRTRRQRPALSGRPTLGWQRAEDESEKVGLGKNLSREGLHMNTLRG